MLIRKHDHFTPTREIRRHVRALTRNHPEGWGRADSLPFLARQRGPDAAAGDLARVVRGRERDRGGGLLDRNVQWFRGVLVFKAHRLLHHSTLGVRVIEKKKKDGMRTRQY